ncbi:MAG: 30S ribosomal protein S10 [Nanoarchaeota archaeon]|nr:30S ribosomal protein S10 [Nanoarchaeota archaeon]MBU4300465.1 30S ribosomal protein S10 [Nanoarchaeota archaeon]MBU4451945.1 30S ribosomal protein S10 [Nanoarchaeota archaeon]MCG2724104.1 30S ribosomal protein S10 [archaeon]
MQIARIRVASTDYKKLEELVHSIKDTAQKFGASVTGPMPLPTKKLKIVTRKSPSGSGAATFERWEMRVHKRVIDVGINERALRQIMRVEVPEGVNIEIELKE